MNTAIPWYQSRAIWAMAATILLSAAAHYGIALPPGVDKDSTTAFLLGVWPIGFAIYERLTATKVLTGSATTAAAVNATTVHISASDAPDLSKSTVGDARKIVSLLVCVVGISALMMTSGCAGSVATPSTVGQGLFAAYGVYDAAVAGANSYAQSPDANSAVVHVLAKAYEASKPARGVVLAYKACVVEKGTSVTIEGSTFPCVGYNFSTSNLLQVETTLRNVAVSLRSSVPSK